MSEILRRWPHGNWEVLVGEGGVPEPRLDFELVLLEI